MKAVILLGGMSNWLYPLSDQSLRAMLPLGNVPALTHLLELLSRHGISDAYIPLSKDMQSVRDHFQDGTMHGVRIHYREEDYWLGTAGCVGLFSNELSQAPFLIVNGNSYLNLDLTPLLAQKNGDKPFFIVGIKANECGDCAFREKNHQTVFWESCHCSFAHAYLAHPEVLSWIPKKRYFDLREQLIPLAISRDCDVRGITLSGTVNPLRSLQDYLEANQEIACASGGGPRSSSRIDPTASLHGPVLMGENVVIEAGALVVGPAVIGRDAVIGAGAVLHESIVGPRVRLHEGSVVRKSILAEDAFVHPQRMLWRTLAFQAVDLPNGHGDLLRLSEEGWSLMAGGAMVETAVGRGRLSRLAKRAFDFSACLVFGPVIALVCLALGILVKLTSKGPVLFQETRQGEGGRDFTLYKLRTMVQGAHLEQAALQAQNESDGPMFKIMHDPRITPLGHWLRKTSLDELPQFLCVLKGDMSLVGPRPLAEKEMKWNPAWRELRLSVKPGLTGPWQVWCATSSDFSSWIVSDAYYVRHGSFILDIRLIFETLAVMVRGRRTQ